MTPSEYTIKDLAFLKQNRICLPVEPEMATQEEARSAVGVAKRFTPEEIEIIGRRIEAGRGPL